VLWSALGFLRVKFRVRINLGFVFFRVKVRVMVRDSVTVP
jgi:hypothetical protein